MRFLLPVLALIAACSDPEPALSKATSLSCPFPGALPFRLSSSGFQKSANETLSADNPRSKDEASDTLGNPGGLTASVYLPDDQRPSAAAVAYHGTKARTTATGGLFAKPLPGENVSLWYYDTDKAAWQSVGRGKTGADGDYDLPAGGFVAPNGRPIYAVLEAEGSCAEHLDYLLAPGSKVIVTDIDGTLTTDDSEIIKQVADDTYVPAMITAADRMLQAWAMKGYTVVYMTARTHVLRPESRGWLADLGFPDGPMITKNGGLTDDVYKTLWMKRLIDDFQWNVVAAYGNADTDITAYANAGVPKDHTFIVGPLAGKAGTMPIPNMDYTQHIASFVAAQPANP
jgi:LNS2-like protein (lipin/Ned1/Smp2)